MSETLRWWLVLQVVAVAALPLCLIALSRLPDRGYALSKPFGLLLAGFTFWFLNSRDWITVLPNSRGGIIAALLLVGLVSAAVAYPRRDELSSWLREHWRYVAGVEALLFVSLCGAVFLRAIVGQISGTEQPMDLMFVNAATRAEHFPPEDPWLSGFTVAYYYFGYLIVAMTGQLAGVEPEVAYNIGLAMIAALSLTGAFGLVYNLVKMREDAIAEDTAGAAVAREQRVPQRTRLQAEPAVATAAQSETGAVRAAQWSFAWRPAAFGLAGALLLVVAGNLVFVLTYASMWGIGGQGFFDWVNVNGLNADEPGRWYPHGFFEFFTASRIYPLDEPALKDETFRVITEFPMFSLVLGDLHPHVMALPFVLLAVGLAMSFYRSDEPLDLTYWIRRPLLLLGSAIIVGALAFINTWDIVTMAFVIVAAAAAANFVQMGSAAAWSARAPSGDLSRPLDAGAWTTLGIVAAFHGALAIILLVALKPAPATTFAIVAGLAALIALLAGYLTRAWWPFSVELLVRAVSFALPLLLLAVDLYLPFYTGFSSQASGVGAVVTRDGITVPGTRPLHLLLFWGPLFAVTLPFVGARILAARERISRAIWIAGTLPGAAVIVAWVIWFAYQKASDDAKLGTGAGGLFEQVGDRGVAWITAFALVAALAAACVALWAELTSTDREEGRAPLFAVALTCVALLLILGTEFFYIGDNFNSRMNTVFKLYYQAWMLLAVAGGFALYYLAARWKAVFPRALAYRRGWAALAAIVLAGSVLYPVGATWNRTDGDPFRRGDYLNGLNHFPQSERDAIDWLKDRAGGQRVVLAEAVGNDYTLASRISAATGMPTVIGWVGHENQWRGSSAPYAGRFEDINTLYTTTNEDEARQIIDEYGITYIFVGTLERSTYGPSGGLDKFESMPLLFESGDVKIYGATGTEASE